MFSTPGTGGPDVRKPDGYHCCPWGTDSLGERARQRTATDGVEKHVFHRLDAGSRGRA